MSNPEETVAAYEALVVRAKDIVSGPPHSIYPYNTNRLRLSICDGEALLAEATTDTSYGDCSIDWDEVHFPASLLSLSDAELAAWKEEQGAINRERVRQRIAREAEENERKERAALAALMAKYGIPKEDAT